MTWGGKLNREPRLNDVIDSEFPFPEQDYQVTIMKSDLISMLRTAARRGGEMVAATCDRYQIQVREPDIRHYHRLVRYEAIKRFVGEK